VNIEKERVRVKARAVKSSNHAAFKTNRIDKSLKIITRRNQDLIFSSKKRKYFEAIRDIGKQNRAFVMAVSNVLMKSMLTKGFEIVKENNRETYINRKKFRHIN
jgi:hypothetical protein